MPKHSNNVVIDMDTSIVINNSNIGYITVSLNDNNEFVINSNGPSVILQEVSTDGAITQESSTDSSSIRQTVFSDLRVNGDIVINKFTQKII